MAADPIIEALDAMLADDPIRAPEQDWPSAWDSHVGTAQVLNREAARLARAVFTEADCSIRYECEPWQDVAAAMHAMWRESAQARLRPALTDDELALAEGYDEWLDNIVHGRQTDTFAALSGEEEEV